MKSLGKQAVLRETFLDGIQTNSRVEQRVVLTNVKGEFFVRDLDSRRQIVQRPDGSFYWKSDVRTLKAMRGSDLVEHLAARFDKSGVK